MDNGNMQGPAGKRAPFRMYVGRSAVISGATLPAAVLVQWSNRIKTFPAYPLRPGISLQHHLYRV
ncbi:UNVERIFIED_CONTAM: hypothetical protein Sangu_2077300 [Sesamum angustifolium]|uniref:Uncharacterized protein n=1 Tax=Sesamum angustifolium TaxID=2727405 RepID=A0AAW2LNB1_9LAMI